MVVTRTHAGVHRSASPNRCNILICPDFLVLIRAYRNGIPIYVCLWDCTVFNLAYNVQPRGHTGMGQVFTFVRGWVVEYCASENATPVLL